MSELFLQFEADKNADTKAIEAELSRRLAKLQNVAAASAETSEQKIGIAETVAIISAAVTLAKEGNSLISEVRKLIPQIVGLIKDIKGLKKVFIEVGSERVALDEVNDDHLQELVYPADIT